MTKGQKPQDPHAKREAENYDRPIPSREFILDLLEQAEGPMNRSEISAALKLEGDEQIEALRRRLRAMERDGQLLCGRKGAYGLVDKMDLIRGRVQAHRDGFGFLIPDDGSDDLFLNSRQMSTVFHGDEVLSRVSGLDQRGRREGVVIEVLKRNTQTLVGRFFADKGVYFVTPDNTRINHDIFISAEDTNGAEQEQYVVVEVTSPPRWRRPASGKVLEVLGDHMAPGLEIDVAIRSHNIPHEWPEAAVQEAAALSAEPAEADKQGRVDVRSLPFVTIDGEDARDFDDAVYCESQKGGSWKLWVAIADVSHYVSVGSALDKEANIRGNSVYFPERVVPMLPEALSNGLCSLKPDVDRLCMICEMDISRAGKLTASKFYEGVMHSHARLTYNKVGAMLDAAHEQYDALRQRYQPLVQHLEELHKLYRSLRAARDKRGAIDFETIETRIIFGPDRKIEDIVPTERNDAHKLIEECMLAANVATANFLANSGLPALYRVHEGPKEEKLENLRAYLGELGLGLFGGMKPTPEDYQRLLEQVADRPDASIIQIMMLRSLRQAVYQPQNEGHFGLNYQAYAHFTSPIRRYPDLLVHRAIRHIIRSDIPNDQVVRIEGVKALPKKAIYPYDLASMLAFGEQASMTERRADDATREVVAWLKCEYLQDRVGEEFAGVIAAVTNFGFFVDLVGVHVEGLVHVSSLSSDYYHFDPAKQRLTGERTRTSFALGDTVSVTVVRVSLDDKKIDFELAGSVVGTGRRKPADRNRGGKPKGSPVSKIAKNAGNKPDKNSSTGKKPKAKQKPNNKKAKQRGAAEKGASKTVAQVRRRKKPKK